MWKHRPLSLALVQYFLSPLWHTNAPTQEQTHKYNHKKNKKIKKKQHPPSPPIPDTEAQRHSNKEIQLLSLAWTCMHIHTSLYSPCGCHQKQPLCPKLCKSNGLLLFSLVAVFSFRPAQSSSSVVPFSYSTSSHLSNTSPTTEQLNAFPNPLREAVIYISKACQCTCRQTECTFCERLHNV